MKVTEYMKQGTASVKSKRKKPWKLKDTDLQYLAKDIKRSGYLLSKSIRSVVNAILNDWNKGFVLRPEKYFPQAGTYVHTIRLLNLVLHAHGLPTIKSLEDPNIQK